MMDDDPYVDGHEQSDADLLDLLRRQGDDPTIVRPVEVRFKGARDKLATFRDTLNASWRVLQLVEIDEAVWALDLERDQRTDALSIQGLLEASLGVEIKHGIEYDGWGCVAQGGARLAESE